MLSISRFLADGAPGSPVDVTEERAHDPAGPPEADGIPDVADDASPRREGDADPQRPAVPGDVPVSLEEYGTTASETRHGEPLSGKLNREQPDTPEVDQGGERLVEPDEGVREDVDKELVGREAGSPEGDLSAEEAAVHETDQAATGDDRAIEEQTATNEEPTG